MKDLNPKQIVNWIGFILLALICGWYGLNFEIGRDGMKLKHPEITHAPKP